MFRDFIYAKELLLCSFSC